MKINFDWKKLGKAILKRFGQAAAEEVAEELSKTTSDDDKRSPSKTRSDR